MNYKGISRAVIFASIIVLLTLSLSCSSLPAGPLKSTPSPAQASSVSEVVPIRIDIADLIAEYEKNDFAANTKYKGKQLEVSGTVFGLGSDLFGNPTLFFAINENDETGLIATFGKDKIDTLTAISKGQRVTVRGQGDGLRIHVQLKYASIVK